MRILCNDENAAKSRMFPVFERAAELCLEKEGLALKNAEISLNFVSEAEIRELNNMYRQVDRSTDVLSFPLIEDFNDVDEDGEEILLGDVVICPDRAEKQAEEYGHSLERESVYLFVHSVLHLLGYDHMEEADKAEMRRREEEIMTLLNLER